MRSWYALVEAAAGDTVQERTEGNEGSEVRLHGR